jgi:lipoprotein-releasing system ATP-binding protein
MSEPLLIAEGLCKSYAMGRTRLQVLREASLRVASGEFVAVTGASGCGKSTLLHILGALDRPDRGHVVFDGLEVFACPVEQRDRLRNETIGFVFQFYHLVPELNVLENTLLPGMVGAGVGRWFNSRSAWAERARQVLSAVGLGERLGHRPAELSGGERQRVAIARALIGQPRLLLADEPTGNLDTTTGAEILELLGRLNVAGQTVVMVTHDAQVARRAHRIVRLADGRIASETQASPSASNKGR